MKIQKLSTNANNTQFKGMWEKVGNYQKENNVGKLNIEGYAYHPFKNEGYIQRFENMKNADYFRFIKFDENKTPIYKVRKPIESSILPFTEEEYKAFKQNPNAKTEINDLVSSVVKDLNLKEKIEFNSVKNFLSLGEFGNLILDENAKKSLSPLEQDLVDISKNHELILEQKTTQNKEFFKVGVQNKQLESKNSFVNFFYKLMGKEHPTVTEEVTYKTFDKNTQSWINEKTTTVRENILKAFKKTAEKSDSAIRNWRIDEVFRKTIK